jgi:hypothetical protein
MIATDWMPWPGQIAWFFRENNPPAGTHDEHGAPPYRSGARRVSGCEY